MRKASTTDDGVIPLEQQLEAGARLYRDAVRRTRERHEQEQQLERTASRDAVFRKDPTPAYLRKQVRARMSTKKEQGGATAQSPVQPAPPSRTRRTGPKAVSPRARKVSPRASRGGRAQSSANATSRRAQPVRRRTDRRTDRRASAASATSECSTATGPSTAADPAEEPSSPPGDDMRLDREYLASLPFMKRLQAYDKIRKLVRACVCACVLSQPVLCCPWRCRSGGCNVWPRCAMSIGTEGRAACPRTRSVAGPRGRRVHIQPEVVPLLHRPLQCAVMPNPPAPVLC